MDDSTETATGLVDTEADPAVVSLKGRGVVRKAAKPRKTKPRTIHLDDELFERVLVQAHRRDMTISDYVALVLSRSVPDHRGRRTDDTEG